VRDICKRAAVGRSTFYAHYAGKDDLMRGGFRLLRDQMMTPPRGAARQNGRRPDGLSFSLAMFEHAREHAHLHRALLGERGSAIAREAVRDMLSDIVRRELASARKPAQETVPRELTVHYVVGAFMGVVAWWLDSGAKQSARQVDALFRQLTTEGLA
jgi:AcrR family transcriptional regulator